LQDGVSDPRVNGSRVSRVCSMDVIRMDVPPAQPAIAPHQPHAVCRGVACLSAGAL